MIVVDDNGAETILIPEEYMISICDDFVRNALP